jgi:[ribosomal protein S5]-alanine N-acetyltransferase
MSERDYGVPLVTIKLRPCAGEAELADPSVTGMFATEMAEVFAQSHTPPWCGYIGRRGGIPMGFGGFKSAPSALGEVEIGYLTFPQYEGQGVATAIAAEMIAIAKREQVGGVSAHTLAEENPSTGVLRRNGFVRDGESYDPDEGIVWRWRLDL